MTPPTLAHPSRPMTGQVVRVNPAALPGSSLRHRLGHQLLLQLPAPLVVGPPSILVGPRALLRTPLLLKLPCQLEAFQHLAHLAHLLLKVNPAALPRSSLRFRLRHQLLMQPPDPLVVGPPSVSAGPRALLKAPLLLKLPCQLHPQASQLEALQHLAHLAGLLPRPWQVLQPHLRIPPLLTHPRSPSSGQEPLLQVPPPANLLAVNHRIRLLLLLSLEPLGAFLHPCPPVPAVVAQLWLTQPLDLHPQHQRPHRLLQLAQAAAP